jgi:hypothetical protein
MDWHALNTQARKEPKLFSAPINTQARKEPKLFSAPNQKGGNIKFISAKPVFTSTKKTKIGGGADLQELQNSKQNYDFNAMKFSAALAKTAKPQQEGD